ncbi:putative ATP-dependent DNA ligase YkoU [Planctomycetes bacterium Poly30]|uniref:DNA ligase (ATP) n=1 Tax=Saltatorellus ferox TaxID=2528018 RepID=A0A518ENG7_9BACT|nr:putative ATP-dependent DNA ligase YkoU [Planctomycetes bacterium Poly30]
MKRFHALFQALDTTRKTSAKEAALVDYFQSAPAADAAWAAHLLLGRKGRRAVNTRLLREWASEISGHPLWLVEESYDAVGDLAETIALLVPEPAGRVEPPPLAQFIEERVIGLAALDEDAKKALVLDTWRITNEGERFLFHKLISGGFRVGVAKGLVARALSVVAGVDKPTMLHRLSGRWEPTAEAWQRLIAEEEEGADPLRPYPFFLAHPVPDEIAEIGPATDFQAEWKWDGIRAQAVRRGEELLLWSRGEDLVNTGFPEITAEFRALPKGTVLDGELLAWDGDAPMGFHALQRRIQRKSVSAKLRAEVPTRFIAYDLLEQGGEDLRALPLADRRARLESLVAAANLPHLGLAEIVPGPTWEELAATRESSRERGVEGLMLKRRDAPYGAGRVRGPWWKWKIDPFTVDTVMIYAQRGHGRRASLYTDYTLGVWDGDQLVPVAKAYSGLTDAEIRRVDHFVRRNIKDRFGPVRVVEPKLVFEIAFEGIQPSPRHKSGIALRFPRIARWREDKPPEEADTLESLRELLGS